MIFKIFFIEKTIIYLSYGIESHIFWIVEIFENKISFNCHYWAWICWQKIACLWLWKVLQFWDLNHMCICSVLFIFLPLQTNLAFLMSLNFEFGWTLMLCEFRAPPLCTGRLFCVWSLFFDGGWFFLVSKCCEGILPCLAKGLFNLPIKNWRLKNLEYKD